MAIRTQVQRLAAKISEARFEWFACRMSFRSTIFEGVCTSIRTKKKLNTGGFFSSHDATARIPFAALATPPKIGEELIVFMAGLPGGSQKLKIDEIGNHPLNPEYRLGLSCV